ncbi:MAG: DNA polymerase I [Acidobacteriota bacterium]|nr:DNA polymerase I [Acidobacteriota bacterium]MDE3043404.1 DNA polymerase I [Acidobacteriota bacterium]MDE3221978.1 DNA polymerase I [Acidobacteriota bacterium]
MNPPPSRSSSSRRCARAYVCATWPSRSCAASSPVANPEEGPLVLLDGMSLAFRAYFALSPDIQTSSGLVTNALHGFASMLISLVKSQRPRALAVAFDLPGGTFRDAMTDDYKGGRAETPADLEPQFDLIRAMCETLAIPVLGVEGFEADDVLATLATWARDEQMPVIVVTGDRDTFQLVQDPYVRVLYNRRGVSDYSLYDEAGIFERCGIEAARYPLLAALRGDASDNLPGVPGVGEKTAAKLFAQYADLDELYAHLDELTPKLRENLANFEARARNNEKVMRLVRDVPLGVKPEDLTLGGWDRAAVHAFFDRFEMNSVRARVERLMSEGLLGAAATTSSATVTPEPKEVHPVAPAATVAPLATVLAGSSPTVALAGDRVAVYDLASGVLALADVDDLFANVGDVALGGHDVKALYRRAEERGARLRDPSDDTAIMAFLVDPVSGHYELNAVVERFLNESLSTEAPSLFGGSNDETLTRDVQVIARLRQKLREEIVQWELTFIYEKVELPLVAVLGRMEARGVRVDAELLRTIAEEFASEAASLDAAIQEIAGHPFKVNSPQQLQVVLFEELGLTPTKKIKSGYSTDATSLEAIVGEHEIIAKILRYREVEKLRSTYGAPLISTIAADGRIHASFNQTVARTGRLSSESPNLHNIPVRSFEGRRLRYAFVPSPGWLLAVSDYNQIELRILAHLSQDEGLLRAFDGHEDVHRSIASSVFGVSVEAVTAEQREQAKAVSYGLAYGMEAFGLSQRLAIPVSEARAIMDRYFEGFPSLRAYMERTIAEIRRVGYSRTEFGRIRPFPDLLTAVGPQRQAAERQAMNAGIQGLAADIFKSALVRLDHALSEAGLEARLILQVHDEVLVEAPPHERDEVGVRIVDALTHAANLRVPLEVSLNWGENWAAAKG